jgi:uncharacterized RDD family membrane protein YckC
MKYAGFWPRLAAGMIDFLIFTPFMVLSWQLIGDSRMAHIYVELPFQLAFMALNFWLVYRFGGSLGKLAMGLRIRMLDGAAITLRGTFLRYSVDMAFGFVAMVGTVIAVQGLTDAQFAGLGYVEQLDLLASTEPAWSTVLTVPFAIWYWGELIVMLTNKKRRALHDFLAGTVVIKVSRIAVPAPEPVLAE